ncbi:helix-turn-helix domain-containing protein [Amycolatopsis sp. NPDC051758]|uniref:helix-turn-helix domain-containing protein n=1 Tax=Amycolatopsis sp. NPDC051758 TaxID=3363935 RepID=UPI003795430B
MAEGIDDKGTFAVSEDDPRASEYSFAARLNLLFEKARHPTEKSRSGRARKWKARELAGALGLSESYVSKLRSGAESNPSLDLIRNTSRFFGVSTAVLTDDDPLVGMYVAAQLDLYAALLDREIDVDQLRELLASPAQQPVELVAVVELRRLLDVAAEGMHESSGVAARGSAGVEFKEPSCN